MRTFIIWLCCGCCWSLFGVEPESQPPTEPALTTIPDEQIDPNTVTYDHLPEDFGVETPWAFNPIDPEIDRFLAEEMATFMRTLSVWKPGNDPNIDRRVQACLSLLALADVNRAAYEADAPPAVFAYLENAIPKPLLAVALARVALHPESITITMQADAFGLAADDREDVRARMYIYSKKMLGRLLNKLP